MQCRFRGRQFGKVALVDDKIIEVPPRRLFTDSKTLGWGPSPIHEPKICIALKESGQLPHCGGVE